MKHIVSRENPHFKALRRLCQSARERRNSARIVLDGMHLIESLEAAGRHPDEIVVSESGQARAEIARYLAERTAPAALTLLADALFSELAAVETPSGILAIAPMPAGNRPIDPACDTVVLDGVQDPGNVGSILRSAAAAGFRQILLSKDCAQAWSPKVLRAGMGAHFLLDLHEEAPLADFLETYAGVSVLTMLAPVAASLFALDLRGPVAWVFGNEGQGVRPALQDCVRCRATIPMPGACESLNVAAAAAICLFEAVRQRTGVLPSRG